MRVDIGTNSNLIHVVLSERNVKTMAKALAVGVCPDLHRTQEDGHLVIITVESDAVHYKDTGPDRQAGNREIQILLSQPD